MQEVTVTNGCMAANANVEVKDADDAKPVKCSRCGKTRCKCDTLKVGDGAGHICRGCWDEVRGEMLQK